MFDFIKVHPTLVIVELCGFLLYIFLVFSALTIVVGLSLASTGSAEGWSYLFAMRVPALIFLTVIVAPLLCIPIVVITLVNINLRLKDNKNTVDQSENYAQWVQKGEKI